MEGLLRLNAVYSHKVSCALKYCKILCVIIGFHAPIHLPVFNCNAAACASAYCFMLVYARLVRRVLISCMAVCTIAVCALTVSLRFAEVAEAFQLWSSEASPIKYKMRHKFLDFFTICLNIDKFVHDATSEVKEIIEGEVQSLTLWLWRVLGHGDMLLRSIASAEIYAHVEAHRRSLKVEFHGSAVYLDI